MYYYIIVFNIIHHEILYVAIYDIIIYNYKIKYHYGIIYCYITKHNIIVYYNINICHDYYIIILEFNCELR